MVYGCWDFNYTDRLTLLNLPSLEERRVRGAAIETFKLLKDMNNIDSNYHLTLKSENIQTNY